MLSAILEKSRNAVEEQNAWVRPHRTKLHSTICHWWQLEPLK